MGIFSKAKKWTHKIAHETGRVAGQVTGSDKVAKYVEQGVLNNPIAHGANLVYQPVHQAGHLAESVKKALRPTYPATSDGPVIDTTAMEEAMTAMGDYLAAMQAAMTREEPAQEPLKQAQVEMDAARADTNRKQLLRRGLMSTYTRYGSQGGTQRLGA